VTYDRLGPEGLQRGGGRANHLERQVRPVFFNRSRTDARLTQVETELSELKRRFSQIEQEWDATTARVTKVLRRIRTSEVAQEREETGNIVGALDASGPSTIATPPDRLTRIRQQLAARGGNGDK